MHQLLHSLRVHGNILMKDGRTEVVFLWEAQAMSEQNLLVLAGCVPAPNTPPLRTVHIF
jgi:hypothetical protein